MPDVAVLATDDCAPNAIASAAAAVDCAPIARVSVALAVE
jgi:hypothetical protein